MTSNQQTKQRQAAGKRSGASRRRQSAARGPIAPAKTEAEILAEIEAAADARMARYEEAATVSSWQHAKAKEQTRGAILDNICRAREVACLTRDYYSAEEVAKWSERYATATAEALDAMVEAARLVEGLAPKQREAVLKALRQTAEEGRSKLRGLAGA